MRTIDGGILLNAGAATWGLAWCPGAFENTAPNDPSGWEYLAIGGYRDVAESRIVGERRAAPGAIQIWNFYSVAETLDHTPTLDLCLAHSGGCVWDLKWCPTDVRDRFHDTITEGASLPRLGLLAAAFGDGSLQIFSVPYPGALRECNSGIRKVVELQPVWRMSMTDSLMWAVNWAPHADHQLMLAGCTNGNVVVWRLKKEDLVEKAQIVEAASKEKNERQYATEKACPVVYFSAHSGAVRSVDWCASDPNLIVSCGHDGKLAVWDIRDPFLARFYWKSRCLWYWDVRLSR